MGARALENIFTVDGVSFSYNGNTALSGISLRVARGECVAMVGANGSGKSTLLKILNGLVFPDNGTVSFRGERLSPATLTGEFLREFRSSVGLVFSEPDVQLFCPTVFDELSFGPLQLGLAPGVAASRVEDILDMTGISALRDRAPYELSAGEKKKVAIASVLAMDPEVLLLDEPTTGLDPGAQAWLFELIETMSALGRTFVVSTHDLSLAAELCPRTIVIDESHSVRADGDTAAILADRAMLLGANIIRAHSPGYGKRPHARVRAVRSASGGRE